MKPLCYLILFFIPLFIYSQDTLAPTDTDREAVESTVEVTGDITLSDSSQESKEKIPLDTSKKEPAITTEKALKKPAVEKALKKPVPVKEKTQLEVFHEQALHLNTLTSELNDQITQLQKLNLVNEKSKEVSRQALPKIEASIRQIIELSKEIHISYKRDKKNAKEQDLDFSDEYEKYKEVFHNLGKSLNQAQSSRDYCFTTTGLIEIRSLNNFNADSIVRLRNELEEISTESQFYYLTINKRLEKSFNDLITSPIPLLGIILKSLFLLYLFRSWLKWLDTREKKHPSSYLWYSRRLSAALKRVLMVYVIASPIYGLFTYSDIKIYIKVCYIYAFARLAIQICDAIAFRRNFIFNQEDRPELRLKSLRIIISFLALVVVFQRISYHFLNGCWMIQSWMYWLLVVLFITSIYVILRTWKETILSEIDNIKDPEFFLKKIKGSSNSELTKELSAFIGAIYFFIKGSMQWILIIISSVEFFRPMMSTFLTLKSINPEEENLEGLLALNNDKYVNIDNPQTVEDYGQNQLKYLSDESHTGLHLIVGEQGIGKTFFLNRLKNQIESHTQTFFYSCSRSKAKDFINEIKFLMEQRNDNKTKLVILIDDLHFLQKPIIGGVDIIDEFMKLIRKGQNNITWYCSINREAWQFLQRVRAKKILFESITKLPKWDMEQIKSMISSRVKQVGENISFQKLSIPKHLDSPQIDGRRKKDLSYYRILNDYSDGNPSIAMYCFNLSIFKDKKTDSLQIHLFNPPSLAELESMPALTYFILRTILQMGSTNREDLKVCAAEKKHLVDDCLNLLLFHGFINEKEQFFSISTRWFRPILIILQRQHLLSK